MKTSKAPTASVTGARIAYSAPRALLALGIQILSLTAIATAAPGDLDPSFGTGGISDPVIPGNAVALARQSDGRIIVVGGGGVGAVVARYTLAGQLDPTFSEDGWTTIDFGGGSAAAVAIQPNGKIVVGGNTRVATYGRFALARLNSDGTLDTSFSGDGKVVPQLGEATQGDNLTSILIQPDGKIVAVGWSAVSSRWMSVARFSATGDFDTSFGSGGVKTIAFNWFTECNVSALLSNGNILLAGTVGSGTTSRGQFGLARLLPNGSIDTSFSGDGWEVCDFASGNDENVKSIAVQADGKIVVSGTAATGINDDYAIMRIMPNGAFDTSFSGDGKILIPIESAAGSPQAGDKGGPQCLIRPDGKILLGGWFPRSTGQNSSVWCLARLDAAGSLDNTFSGDGFSIALPDSSVDSIYAITPQPGRLSG